MKNLPEIDDNSQLPQIPQRVGKSIAVYSPSWSDFSFIVLGADGKPIHPDRKIDEYEAIYNKYSALGFSSEVSANAYFNIHILNNTPNNQLGYLHWLATIFYSENYDHEMNINLFRSHYMINFNTKIMESFSNPIQPNISIHLPKQPQAIFDEIRNFNTIFLWTEENIKYITFDAALHAEQHQLLIHPLANQTTTDIDTRYMKDAEYVSIRLYQPPSTWIIENNTNSKITVLLCADDSRKIEENRVYGLGTPNGCIRTPIELVTYSNKLHPKCTMQLTPFSSQIFDSSIFLKNKQNYPTKIKHDF